MVPASSPGGSWTGFPSGSQFQDAAKLAKYKGRQTIDKQYLKIRSIRLRKKNSEGLKLQRTA